jgi:hypothetical protein
MARFAEKIWDCPKLLRSFLFPVGSRLGQAYIFDSVDLVQIDLSQEKGKDIWHGDSGPRLAPFLREMTNWQKISSKWHNLARLCNRTAVEQNRLNTNRRPARLWKPLATKIRRVVLAAAPKKFI